MGDFVLSGAADALAPIAEKLGLTEVASVPSFAQDARGPSHWRRIFPRSKRKPRVASVTAQPSRPCAQGRDAMVKAVEYALWLAKRDGAPIAHKDWRVYDAAKWDAVKWDFSAPGAGRRLGEISSRQPRRRVACKPGRKRVFRWD